MQIKSSGSNTSMDKSESEMCMCTCSSTHLAEKVIGSYPKHNTHPLKIELSAPMEGMIAS